MVGGVANDQPGPDGETDPVGPTVVRAGVRGWTQVGATNSPSVPAGGAPA